MEAFFDCRLYRHYPKAEALEGGKPVQIKRCRSAGLGGADVAAPTRQAGNQMPECGRQCVHVALDSATLCAAMRKFILDLARGQARTAQFRVQRLLTSPCRFTRLPPQARYARLVPLDHGVHLLCDALWRPIWGRAERRTSTKSNVGAINSKN